MDPPYELAPKEPSEVVDDATQLAQGALLMMLTLTPLASVVAHELLLLLLSSPL
jgi:hypothetical protein